MSEDSQVHPVPTPNYFLIIPAHILENPKIDDSTAILFGRIASLSNQRGYCFASDEYLAEISKSKLRALQYRLKTLEDEGYIRRETKKCGLGWDRKIIPNFNYEAHEPAVTKRTSVRDRSAPACGILVKEKEIDKNNSPPQSERAAAEASVSSHALRLSEFLFEEIKKGDPKARQPNFEAWAKELDKMNRRDKRSWEEIEAMIKFAMADDFWSKNILSTQKLRKQATTLFLRMSSTKPLESKENAMEAQLREFKHYSKVMEATVGSQILKTHDAHVWIKPGVVIRYLEHGFKEQVENQLRKLGVI